MNLILQSISKIVFLLIAVTVCASFMMGILDSKDFMMLAGMAFAFYFSIKSTGTSDDMNECAPKPPNQTPDEIKVETVPFVDTVTKQP